MEHSGEDKYFDIDEAMVDYAEMTSFNFESSDYLELAAQKDIPEEYSKQPFAFKYGSFDVVDMLQAFFAKGVKNVESLWWIWK